MSTGTLLFPDAIGAAALAGAAAAAPVAVAVPAPAAPSRTAPAAVVDGVLVPDDSQVPVVLSYRSQARVYPVRCPPDPVLSGVLTAALTVATEVGAMLAVSAVCTWLVESLMSVPSGSSQ